MDSDERAVSDVIGYVLTFSLILLAVGTVTAVGFAGLEDARDAERVNNAERAFDILASNVDELHRQQAPSRATEIRLADAQLGFAPTQTEIEVTVGGTTVADVAYDPITYTAADTTYVYDGTAVIREERGGAAVVRAPSWSFSEEQVIVPLVVTRQDGSASVGGTTTALIRTKRAEGDPETLERTTNDDVVVEITTTEARAEAWARALERKGGDCSVSGATANCDVDADRIIVTRTDVDVEIG
ncbi:DUF7289 family protein [Natronomonas sp.]|uniref:DUF7289 family protein n=1 Tax=Natronomonas sp. TaxID=2184060 RepID=UPI002FC2E349